MGAGCVHSDPQPYQVTPYMLVGCQCAAQSAQFTSTWRVMPSAPLRLQHSTVPMSTFTLQVAAIAFTARVKSGSFTRS
jgi:hypothetical protein